MRKRVFAGWLAEELIHRNKFHNTLIVPDGGLGGGV